MRRRQALACVAGALVSPLAEAAASDWERRWGYPTGWGPAGWTDKEHRIGNYSGGFEQMFRARRIIAPPSASPLAPLSEDAAASFAPVAQRASAYMKAWPISGMLIARKGTVLFESYQFSRTPDMRMTSWSMAKSVTSLLLGICVDRGLVKSLEDRAEDYVPELRGTLHGGITLRNLANMSSGAAIVHDRDNPELYPRAFTRHNSDLEAAVRGWNASAEPQGTRYNYNELCPLTIGMVIRRATGKTLAAFCEEALWQPLGAEGDASWLCDGQGREFNCIGFGARLRDWGRLGQMVAQRGAIDGRQVVSARWIDECASWSEADAQARFGRAGPTFGYKFFFWHGRADGNWMMMVGHDGQRVIVERATQTVVVQTAVDQSAMWQPELNEIVRAAARSGPGL
ncbi:serine hydrolase domain-containing protein [Ramlibacter sp. PS4R-6]|uniref:serine hydrolase domain-containing protein n=1 Tax=Ramlibacter sp. PS4R-6 TaxID=3133438 RepID=UPI00309B4820